MKTLFFLLLFAVSASAQTLKWERDVPLSHSGGEIRSAYSEVYPDGAGNCFIKSVIVSDDWRTVQLVWVSKRASFVITAPGGVTLPEIDVLRVMPRNLYYAYDRSTLPTAIYRAKIVEKGVSIRFEHPLEGSEVAIGSQFPQDRTGYFTLVKGPKGEPLKIRRFSN